MDSLVENGEELGLHGAVHRKTDALALVDQIYLHKIGIVIFLDGRFYPRGNSIKEIHLAPVDVGQSCGGVRIIADFIDDDGIGQFAALQCRADQPVGGIAGFFVAHQNGVEFDIWRGQRQALFDGGLLRSKVKAEQIGVSLF